jgi:hypothetical protein
MAIQVAEGLATDQMPQPALEALLRTCDAAISTLAAEEAKARIDDELKQEFLPKLEALERAFPDGVHNALSLHARKLLQKFLE